MRQVSPSTNSENARRDVLVLDDDADLRESLADLLAVYGSGGCVCLGSLAELASRETDALACRLAILDVNLGVGQPSGIDALNWLKERGFSGCVVFLTGHAATHPLVAEARRRPNVGVLAKPVDCERLRQLLEEAGS